MEISASDVRGIARLARLDLTESEVERFRRELSTILAYVEQLEALEAGSASEPARPDHRLREDGIVPWKDLEGLHAAAPDFAEGFYRVPRVIE